jgi:hypothetical protein
LSRARPEAIISISAAVGGGVGAGTYAVSSGRKTAAGWLENIGWGAISGATGGGLALGGNALGMAAGKVALSEMGSGAALIGIQYEAQTPRDEWTAKSLVSAMDLGALGNLDPNDVLSGGQNSDGEVDGGGGGEGE